jgi:hypothetical protein
VVDVPSTHLNIAKWSNVVRYRSHQKSNRKKGDEKAYRNEKNCDEDGAGSSGELAGPAWFGATREGSPPRTRREILEEDRILEYA